MTPPTQLDILSTTYDVLYHPLDDPTMENWGECYKDDHLIRIRRHNDPLFMLDTLMHEAMHALWYEYQMDDSESEEAAVGKMSSGIVKLLKANPELVEYINNIL